MSVASVISKLVVGVAATAFAVAQTPTVTGMWEMDSTKSHVSDGRTMMLTIENVANKLKLTSTVHPKAGSDVTSQLTCTADGKQCEFREGDHKSQVSMWFLGAALNICKTDGPPGDVVNMWKLDPSSDGKLLTVTVQHIDPNAAEETLVFTKKNS